MKRKTIISIIAATLLIMLTVTALLFYPSQNLAQSAQAKVTATPPATSLTAAGLQTKAQTAFSGSIILYVGSSQALVNDKATRIDENPAVVPFIENSRTLMPLGFVAQNLGFTVEWHEIERSITLTQSDIKLEFTLGSNIMKNNGTPVEMETAAISKNGRTLVPISYVAKALGINVTYDRGLIILDSEKTFDLNSDREYIDSLIARLSGLPIVGSAENFNTLMKDIAKDQQEMYKTWEVDKDMAWDDNIALETELAFGVVQRQAVPEEPIADIAQNDDRGITATAPTAPPTQMPQADEQVVADEVQAITGGGDAAQDHSTTNTQVEGVDEADIVKTDGDYLYHLAQGTLNIVKADGQGHMHQVCAMQMQYQNSDFYPLDMYVDGSRLCVIGTEFSYQYQPEITDSSAKYYHYAGKNFVKALVYNIEDKSAPALIKEFSAEGDLLTSRKVDNILYLVLNYNMSFYGLAEPSQAVPLYYDSTFFSNTKAAPLEFGNMRYFPGAENESMLIISGMDITDPDSAAQTTSIIGSGSTVYMSRSALYIAKYSYGFSPFLRIMPIDDADSNVGGGQARDNTTFFKFALDNGFAIYQGSGEADGTVLNQYSMDEYNGYFRAAMTVNTLGGSSKNALNIFDAGMALCGSITDMAPGERVYSARFMGERAFMVTYRTVDPLFALDLSNPYSPRVLGELKIPGYSSYLHPYDENHLIGFGRETEELTTIDSKGKVVDVRAVNRGLKLALFDISDMTNPKELHVVTIGDENTYSELLNNPKALLFSKEKGFIAFPVNDYGYSAGEAKAFNGAHVYNISPAGIDLRGVINQAGANRNDHKYWYYDNNIQRILYIGNTFYSASESGLQSNDMESLKLIEFLQYGK